MLNNEINSTTSHLNLIKDKVIVSNNAHTIYEHIKSLENDPKHRLRWIWELMQNAQDANASEIIITFEDNVLSFEHNGQPFTEDEITHLIFHGSSKPPFSGKRGKFGTGFMTTHLLSKRVQIKGCIKDGGSFDFELTREGNNDAEMARSLSTSWENFINSVSIDTKLNHTIFKYIDLAPGIPTTIEAILESLPNLMPYVLIFSDKINKVSINDKGVINSYLKKADDYDKFKTILFESSRNQPPIAYKMWLHTDSENEIVLAIPLDEQNKIKELPLNVPRLFLTFPLIGTDNAFSLPFLINSEYFEPSSEREKLWLNADSQTSQTIKNKELLEKAFKEYIKFCYEIIDSRIENPHLLVNFGAFRPIEWIDSDWYKAQILNIFNSLDDLPLIKVSKKNCEELKFTEAFIPFPETEDKEDAQKIWELCDYLFSHKIPEQQLARYWQDILYNRQSFVSTLSPVAFTIQKLCNYINDIPENKLSELIVINLDQLEFIKSLILTLEHFKLEKYWNEFAILPNQNNILKKSANLKQEILGSSQEIDEKLKDIGENVLIPVRPVLLHKDITINSQDHKLSDFDKDTLVSSLITHIKKTQIDKANFEFQKATISLLGWLMENERWNELIGYPVKMKSDKWERLQNTNEPFLLPESKWKTNFRDYNDLFPADYILHDDNSIIFSDNIIEKAQNKNFVLSSPLYWIKDEIKSSDIKTMVTRRVDKETISKHENSEWSLVEPIVMSKVAYFSFPKDKNVIDKARGSRIRTQLLLKFIVETLLEEDIYGFTRTEVNIQSDGECQRVGVYPSHWLRDIKNRDWVKDQANTAKKPSVESLLPYFSYQEGDENILYNSLEKQNVSRLLHFLDIGVGDLLRNIRAGNNEEERISWDQSYVSILMNKSLTPEKVKRLLSDSAFIKIYEDKIKQEELTKTNNEIGTAVETAFRKAFENVPQYQIYREPIGSDFIIECDFPHKLLLDLPDNRKFVIEIKSSRSTEVRMTKTQGETSFENKNYILCVVPLFSDVIDETTILQNARFVTNISELLYLKVKKIREITSLHNEASKKDETNGISATIEGTDIRYIINQQHWNMERETVLNFKEFVDNFVNSEKMN